MPMTPEAKVKKEVRDLLKARFPDAYVFTPATGGYGKSGVPDIVCSINGWFIGIECKANGNKPTKLQLHNLEQIAASGGTSFVVDDTSLGVFDIYLASNHTSNIIKGRFVDLTGHKVLIT